MFIGYQKILKLFTELYINYLFTTPTQRQALLLLLFYLIVFYSSFVYRIRNIVEESENKITYFPVQVMYTRLIESKTKY